MKIENPRQKWYASLHRSALVDKPYRDFYDKKSLTYPEHDRPSIVRYSKAIGLADLSSGMRVLDLACKDAVLLELLRQRGQFDYVGLDISERVVEDNRAREPDATWVAADILEGAPIEDASFDRIFALEILEHVPNPPVMLKEIHRMLKPGGLLLISVPNPYYYTEFINEVRGYPDTEGHLFAFRDANIRALLEMCGFEIEDRVGTYIQIPKRLRGAFSKHAFWLVERVSPLLARSRIYRCRHGDVRMRGV